MGLAWVPAVALVFAAAPCALFVRNLFVFRRPVGEASGEHSVSVLIPARNEAAGIADCLRSVLANRGVDFEAVVLDDQSSDETAAIVERFAAEDSRVRCLRGGALPANWCGKQHACWLLAQAARHSLLCFIDADVRLSGDCLRQVAGERERQRVALLSGFPRQQTGTWSEQLLIPLMHFILLGLLPMDGMKRSKSAAFSAGCGQFLFVEREAYFAAGGHAAICASRHDGVALPHAFRRAGFATGLCDITELASCRMYHGASEVVNGLMKNATEGLGHPARIVPFTVFLLAGQVVPFGLLAIAPGPASYLAAVCALAPRVVAVSRFRQSLPGALLHPVGIVLLLAIQWTALLRELLKLPSTWKGRSYASS